MQPARSISPQAPKTQILVEADADFIDPAGGAGDGKSIRAQPRIGRCQRHLDLHGICFLAGSNGLQGRRYHHLFAGSAQDRKIILLAQPRAGTVLAPFMTDQTHGRHDIEQRPPKRIRHTVGFARPAEFRISLFVLRPEPMDDEAMLVVRIALHRAPRRIVFQAPAWRPGRATGHRNRSRFPAEQLGFSDACRWPGCR